MTKHDTNDSVRPNRSHAGLSSVKVGTRAMMCASVLACGLAACGAPAQQHGADSPSKQRVVVGAKPPKARPTTTQTPPPATPAPAPAEAGAPKVVFKEFCGQKLRIDVTEIKCVGNHSELDLAPLFHLRNVRKLVVKNVAGINPWSISMLVKLEVLVLQHVELKNLHGLGARHTKLRSLDVSSNQITDIAPLTQLPTLTELNISHNQITDIAPLTRVRSLTQLTISANPIADYQPLAKLTSLRKLAIRRSTFKDTSVLKPLTQLVDLTVSRSKITELRGLGGLVELRELDISGNRGITNLAPLANLRKLELLYAYDTPVRDVRPLSKLTKLRELGLFDTRVRDVRPLRANKALRTLKVPDSVPRWQIRQLQQVNEDLKIKIVDRNRGRRPGPDGAYTCETCWK